VSAAADTWPASTAFTRLIEALERHGSRITGNGRQRKAQCPHHPDRVPSLSVTDGESRVLVHCFVCDTDDVLAELGLGRSDLFDEPRQRQSKDDWTPWDCPCRPVARYPYVDEAGQLLYEVVRGEHKEFAQRRPDPSSRSGWRWSGIKDVRHVLYRLPRILAAPPPACVFLVEGEKDVHALEAAGETATCKSGGACKPPQPGEPSSWLPGYTEALAGRDVLIVADKDKAGRDHAEHVASQLDGHARFCWIVEAAAGKDAADHLAAGLGITDFAWWA
jgi:hypothetical protein